MGECHHYVDYGLGSYAQERHHGPRCYSCGGSHPTEWCSRGQSPPRSLLSHVPQGWGAAYDEDVPSTSACRRGQSPPPSLLSLFPQRWGAMYNEDVPSTSARRPPNGERAAPSKKKQKQPAGPRCVFCRGQHQPYNCDQFKTPQSRMATAKAHSLCLGCLHKGHRIEECRYRRPCAKCKGDHHIAFCEGNRSKPKTRAPKAAKKIPTTPKQRSKEHSPPFRTPSRVASKSSVEFVVRLDAELEGFFDEPVPSTSFGGQPSPVSTKCAQWKMWTPADAAQASGGHGEHEDTAEDGLPPTLQLEDEWEVGQEDKSCSSSSTRGQNLPSSKHSSPNGQGLATAVRRPFDHLNSPPRDVFLRRSSELGESAGPATTKNFEGRPSAELVQNGANAVASRPPPQALVDVRMDAASGDSDIEFVGVVTRSSVKAEVPSNHTVNLQGLRSIRAKRLKDCRAQLNDDKLEFEEERLLFGDRMRKFEEESRRDRKILDDEWRQLRIEKETLAAQRDALEEQRSQARKAHAMLRQYKISLDAQKADVDGQKADVEGRKTALIARDLRLDAREKELDERQEQQEARARELSAKAAANVQQSKELDEKKDEFKQEKATFEDAKRQAEDAGKLMSAERARLFEKSAMLAIEEANLQRRRRQFDDAVETFNKEKERSKRTTTSTTGASFSKSASNASAPPAADGDLHMKKLKQLLLVAKTELEDAQHQNAVQKEQLDRANERVSKLEADLDLLKNELEALRVNEKERFGAQNGFEIAAPQANAAVNSSDELSKLERENTVLRLSLEFRKERSQRVLERQRRLYVLKRRDDLSKGAKANRNASPSSETSSSCRVAVTNAIRQRPQQSSASAASPQKALSTARKPPAKWTDNAKQSLLQKLREADGELPPKTVQVYADFIAANLHSPVKLEELMSFLRKRDADNAAVVGRIARLAETLRP